MKSQDSFGDRLFGKFFPVENSRTVSELKAIVAREISMRKRVYGQMVDSGRMSLLRMEVQIEDMISLLNLLDYVDQHYEELQTVLGASERQEQEEKGQ